MNCPVCNMSSFEVRELEAQLEGHCCQRCRGIWLRADQYHAWNESRDNLMELDRSLTHPDMSLVSTEKNGMKLCPTCKHILVKYRVGHGVDFALNRCGQCGGVWFDGNEWLILKSRNLHEDVHMIFSDRWQADIRRQESEGALEQMWKERIGEEDLRQLKRISNWLDMHERSQDLYAFLLSSTRGELHTEQ